MEVLHAAALLPALVGTCCTIGARSAPQHGVAIPIVGAVAMLAAMVDAALGLGMLPPLVWAGILLVLAIATGAAVRFGGGAAGGTVPPMRVHGILGLVLMAGMVLAMGSGPAVTSGHTHGAGALAPLLSGAGVAYAAFSAAIAVRRGSEPAASPVPGVPAARPARTGTPASPAFARVEVASMGAAALLMGIAVAA